VCYDGEGFRTFTSKDGLPGDAVSSIVEDREGFLWFGALGGLVRWDPNKEGSVEADSTELPLVTYTVKEGLTNNAVRSLLEDRAGNLWVGTIGAVSRYNRQSITFTTQDGLLHDHMSRAAMKDRHGHLWFGTWGGGVLRYDGDTFTTFSEQHKLGDTIIGVTQDRHGHMWFTGSGLVCYDGDTFTRFTTKDGLLIDRTAHVAEDRAGDLWISSDQGTIRYDGHTFIVFTEADGLKPSFKLLAAQNGHVWFTHSGIGASRYNGHTFDHFTQKDGLAEGSIRAIYEDRDGHIWFGSNGDGVSRYDGSGFETFTRENGLAHDAIRSIYQSLDGHMWFGTDGGVVSRYDGRVFQTLSDLDGLTGQSVRSIIQDEEGDMWFGTYGGLTRYKQSEPEPPRIFVDAVVADRRFEPSKDISIPSTVALMAFEFHGKSFTTAAGQLVYLYRLRGHENQWQQTRQRRVEYANIAPGEYVFEVQAVDRDLVYSAGPASVSLEVYYQPAFGALALDEVNIDDVFASFYRTYAQRPFGSVRVSNNDPNPVEATLRFYLPGWMRYATEIPLTLAPQSAQTIELTAVLDPVILDLEEPVSARAEISLSFTAGGQTLALQEAQEVTVYGRGALRWDEVARAAAFIAPTDAAVTDFARPTLVAFEQESKILGRPGHHLTQAMVLFEALKQHGVRYIADANHPYSQARADQVAIDHIQYPAQVLQHKAGDCDDLTVLYAALLESAGIATALVDYPEHIFLLFDAGLARDEAYKLPVAQKQYLVWQDRVWIPLEVTLLDRSFAEAWQAGAEQLAKFSGVQQRRRLVSTALAWERYPAANPVFAAATVEAPNRQELEAGVAHHHSDLAVKINEHLEKTYLDSLKADPENDRLRTQLLKVYVALRRYDDAISVAYDHLMETQAVKASVNNQLASCGK
jgi:streptogramin lyase